MASIHKQIDIDADPDEVWDAVRDFGALHKRFVRGFVIDAQLDADARIVTFASGTVQREPLIDCDDVARRLVYGALDSPIGMTHYNASVEVSPGPESGTRIEWIVDVLPHELRDFLDQAMDLGAAAMKRTLEREEADDGPVG
jgi:Polyketide cyclase / dehydrase and lipid transport